MIDRPGMPLCKCGEDYATVEFKAAGTVMACGKCASMLEMVAKLSGVTLLRRPVLGLVRPTAQQQ